MSSVMIMTILVLTASVMIVSMMRASGISSLLMIISVMIGL